MMINQTKYILTHEATKSATGFFAPIPQEKPGIDETLKRLAASPMDSFLHQFALNLVTAMDREELDAFIRKGKQLNNILMKTLACEGLIITRNPGRIKQHYSGEEMDAMTSCTPLILLKSLSQPNQRLHKSWITLFKANIKDHQDLPPLEKTGLPPICAGECMIKEKKGLEISTIFQLHAREKTSRQTFPLEDTIRKALAGLKKAGVTMDEEMRHHSSLSPYALVRKWKFKIQTRNGRNSFRLEGEQTSYGKGLTLEEARASLLMEIVERYSAYASISPEGVEGYEASHPIIRATYRELLSRNRLALDPSTLALEVDYQNEPLYWLSGTTPGSRGDEEILIPAQLLFLFSNLDEINLFSSLGSTGMASGNTMEQAKVSALLEVIERHQEGTVPFDLTTCFKLIPERDDIIELCDVYRSHGIQIYFQDITPASGIPCCKCFVRSMDGEVHKGSAAGLNARKVLISALTETPYPFPGGGISSPAPTDLNLVGFNDLPDYSTGDPASDLALLEKVLLSWELKPVYMDMTRPDIGLPVVKAVIPGMEILGDFDDFSRVHPELFQNYLNLTTIRPSRPKNHQAP